MIKAVLFDLDGTLVNSLCDLANSTNYALNEFGFPTHETEKYKYFVGDGMPKLIERVLPDNKRDDKTQKEVLELFLSHYAKHFVDETVVYDGIEALLGEISKSGIKTAVISNKAQPMAEAVVDKLFGQRFNIVCGKQEGFPAKPDPTLTLKVIEELKVKPNECLFVGDSGMDMAVAVNADCIGVGVLWGFRTKEELEQNGAKYIVSNPSEILDIIGEKVK
ncbi:MAG: HAD family hydrolase [Ruminococcaceae bacterium]|nr:HAD family hydrolase [Oscillospiraceae bacterium]